jgi:hypothetical protein
VYFFINYFYLLFSGLYISLFRLPTPLNARWQLDLVCAVLLKLSGRKAEEVFLIGIVSVEFNWVHSVLRPPIGLLCQPRVIMIMENLVK